MALTRVSVLYTSNSSVKILRSFLLHVEEIISHKVVLEHQNRPLISQITNAIFSLTVDYELLFSEKTAAPCKFYVIAG